MMAAIWVFVRPYVWKAALILGAVLTVLGVIARIKHAGRLQERAEAIERTAKAERRRTEVENEARERSRDSGVSAVDELRRDWSRD